MSEPERQIGFEQLGIGSVLSRHTLRVPLHQREYSWTEREITDLFQDLAREIAKNASEYFLGSIVTVPRRLGMLEVVDGQQRLATTAILLAAIRNYLRGRDTEKLIMEQIENSFLSVIDREARARVSRLRLNVLDSDYFDRRIVGGDKSATMRAQSHRLINQAADLASRHISRILSPYDDKTHGDILNTWVDFIEHRSIVILLKVPSGANAYRMFETLNDRGLRTSQSDLVKSYLFDEANAAERLEDAQQRWASMKAVIESIDLDQDEDLTVTFLRQSLISSFGHLRKEDVYDTVEARARGSAQAIHFLSMLDSGAVDYAAMLNPAHQKWNSYPPSTRRSIQALVELRIKFIRPLLLSIMRSLDTKNTDLALQLILNMSVRFLIVGGARSGRVEEGLAEIAKDVSDSKIKNTKDMAAELQKIAPSDIEFEQEFAVATVSQPHLARYYLRSLELTVKGEPTPYFIPNDDQTVINLEHILPKNMGGNWPDFSQEEADALYRRIGNMVLLKAKQNSDLGGAPFSEKREAYKDSGYELTKQVAELVEWTADEIAKRQRILAGFAVKTWPLSVK